MAAHGGGAAAVPRTTPSLGARVRRAWRLALGAGFLLAGLRFESAAISTAGPDLAPALTLAAGSLALGAWNPSAALFAYTLAVPLFCGLDHCDLLGRSSTLSLVFPALWMGMASRGAFLWCRARLSPANHSMRPNPGASGSRGYLEWGRLCAEMLIAAVLLSLAWQLWRNRGSTELWVAVRERTVLGDGDPWYFLSSALIWLQGLAYFEWLLRLFSDAEVDGTGAGRSAASWAGAVFPVYAATMAVFVLFQLAFHIPEGWTAAGLQSPYEDISSFGSIAMAVLIFAAATLMRAPVDRLLLGFVTCACLIAMVVASWSRGAWLAGAFFLFLVSAFRLPRRWTAALVAVPACVLILFNVGPRAETWESHPYLGRLAALARIESPAGKDPVRMHLYGKAIAMIHHHPLVGSGIGSFFLTSVNYSLPSDPYGSQPEFAHNVFLMVAAELGLPVAALLAGLLAWAIWSGLCAWRRGRQLPALGMTLALGAYLQTQMTANSLNIYVSNQFFVWFLVAAILAVASAGRRRPALLLKPAYP
jgi:O-antigen ligase